MGANECVCQSCRLFVNLQSQCFSANGVEVWKQYKLVVRHVLVTVIFSSLRKFATESILHFGMSCKEVQDPRESVGGRIHRSEYQGTERTIIDAVVSTLCCKKISAERFVRHLS
jgi:hypothetical protein